MAGTRGPRGDSPRARYREQTRGEIKEIAWRQLAEGGGGNIALTRIAKEVGLSGPALYRYFDSRDALLTELIRDAYADLAAAVGAAAGRSVREPARDRLLGLGAACRDWAVAHPHRYLLIGGTPVPGYTAPADTLDSARAVLGPFLGVFAGARPTASVAPLIEQTHQWVASDETVAAWVREQAPDLAADRYAVALAGALFAWPQMHGVISLEVSGQFTGMGHDGATLLSCQLDTLADSFQLR
ncbi:TetR/AcrR family transcriptional regulator [Streptomyces sp. NPDC046465]|uniref:TetR/AcrR family transcriptional regulator n=1 Tax=Streptomyces sp. NPDC046465 TaxID=3155810 RepID=UPI0033E8F637